MIQICPEGERTSLEERLIRESRGSMNPRYADRKPVSPRHPLSEAERMLVKRVRLNRAAVAGDVGACYLLAQLRARGVVPVEEINQDPKGVMNSGLLCQAFLARMDTALRITAAGIIFIEKSMGSSYPPEGGKWGD